METIDYEKLVKAVYPDARIKLYGYAVAVTIPYLFFFSKKIGLECYIERYAWRNAYETISQKHEKVKSMKHLLCALGIHKIAYRQYWKGVCRPHFICLRKNCNYFKS